MVLTAKHSNDKISSQSAKPRVEYHHLSSASKTAAWSTPIVTPKKDSPIFQQPTSLAGNFPPSPPLLQPSPPVLQPENFPLSPPPLQISPPFLHPPNLLPLNFEETGNDTEHFQNLPNDNEDSDSESMMDDRNLSPQPFRGRSSDDPETFLRQFMHYCQYKEYTEPKKIDVF